MHFFVAKLLSIAVMTYTYVYYLRNLCRWFWLASFWLSASMWRTDRQTDHSKLCWRPVKTGRRLPLLSAGSAVTFKAAEHHRSFASTELHCSVTDGHVRKRFAQGCYLTAKRSGVEPASRTPLPYWLFSYLFTYVYCHRHRATATRVDKYGALKMTGKQDVLRQMQSLRGLGLAFSMSSQFYDWKDRT